MSGGTRVLSPPCIRGAYRDNSTLLHLVIIPKLLPTFQGPLVIADKLWRSHTHTHIFDFIDDNCGDKIGNETINIEKFYTR